MRNEQVAEAFVEGREAKTGNMFVEGNVVYSYGYHFPIAIRLRSKYLVNMYNYSNSTRRHKSYVEKAIVRNEGWKEVVYMTTEELKDVIRKGVDDIVVIRRDKEIIEHYQLKEIIETYYKSKGLNTTAIRNRMKKFFEEMSRLQLLSSV